MKIISQDVTFNLFGILCIYLFVFFCYRYTIGMFKKGYQKTLDVDDLYNPITSDRSTILGDRLERLVFIHVSFILSSFILVFSSLRVFVDAHWFKCTSKAYQITSPGVSICSAMIIIRTSAREINDIRRLAFK